MAARWVYPYAGQPGQRPHPKQGIAHQAVADEILFGGAAGPGKTDWLIAQVLRPCLTWPGFSALIIRRQLVHLQQQGGIISRLRARIPRSVGTYNASQHVWYFRNGSTLQLGMLDNDADAERYVGAEYGIIGWDQVEQLTEWQYTRLFHPLRMPLHHPAVQAGFRPHMACTANPGGPGHMWVKARWVDPAPPMVVWKTTPTEREPLPRSRVYVPATLDDNPSMPDWYRAQLDAIVDDQLRKALKDGDWDVYAGSRFGHLWRRAIHVVTPEDYPVSAAMPKGLAIDYGLEHPWCALWAAVGSDGLVIVYRELHESGLTPSQQAAQIRFVEEQAGERQPGRPMPTALSPDAWARDPSEPSTAKHGGVEGANVTTVRGGAGAGSKPPPRKSIAWHYQQAGIRAERANDDRLSGTMLIADKLGVRADGRPRVVFHNTCLETIKQLPAIPRDKSNPEKHAKQDGDDAVDTLRYLLQLVAPGDYRAPPGDTYTGPPTRTGLRNETAGLRTRPM